LLFFFHESFKVYFPFNYFILFIIINNLNKYSIDQLSIGYDHISYISETILISLSYAHSWTLSTRPFGPQAIIHLLELLIRTKESKVVAKDGLP